MIMVLKYFFSCNSVLNDFHAGLLLQFGLQIAADYFRTCAPFHVHSFSFLLFPHAFSMFSQTTTLLFPPGAQVKHVCYAESKLHLKCAMYISAPI